MRFVSRPGGGAPRRGARVRDGVRILLLALPLTLSGVAPTRASDSAAPETDAVPASPRAVLARVLANSNPTRRERLALQNYHGERPGLRREIEVWIERSGDAFKILGTFVDTGENRGTGFLVLPPAESALAGEPTRIPANQFFVYLSTLRTVRRISGAQRADPFFGTHLSQGDVEPHPVGHFDALQLEEGHHDGDPVYVLTVRPLFEAGYELARLTVRRQDAATLRIEQFRDGSERPIRVFEIDPGQLERVNGHVLPRRFLVRDGRGRGRTEVTILDRSLHDDVPDSYFSTGKLLREGH